MGDALLREEGESDRRSPRPWATIVFCATHCAQTTEAGMGISPAPHDYQTLIAAASLIVGPLLMTIGDLFHPHLLLFIGTSRTKWMCVNNSAMDGLPAIALASSPRSGRARSRLSMMVLFRSQESSRGSSRRWSRASDIFISPSSYHRGHVGTESPD